LTGFSRFLVCHQLELVGTGTLPQTPSRLEPACWCRVEQAGSSRLGGNIRTDLHQLKLVAKAGSAKADWSGRSRPQSGKGGVQAPAFENAANNERSFTGERRRGGGWLSHQTAADLTDRLDQHLAGWKCNPRICFALSGLPVVDDAVQPGRCPGLECYRLSGGRLTYQPAGRQTET
jgi:hypothetical protein